MAFGWALSRILHFDASHFLPLWMGGALSIYNLDRLKTDPTDALNTPDRARHYAPLRSAGMIIVILSSGMVFAIPLVIGDRPLFLLVLLGSLISLNYSVPLLERHAISAQFIPVIFWTWCVLLFNMILCDQRDLEGDRTAGVRTLPLMLGPALTTRLLFLLLALIAGLAPGSNWLVALYGGALMLALKKPRAESFYEWWVEGILFIPALTFLKSIL